MPELVQFAWIAVSEASSVLGQRVLGAAEADKEPQGECDYCELDSSINSGVSDSPDPANP